MPHTVDVFADPVPAVDPTLEMAEMYPPGLGQMPEPGGGLAELLATDPRGEVSSAPSGAEIFPAVTQQSRPLGLEQVPQQELLAQEPPPVPPTPEDIAEQEAADLRAQQLPLLDPAATAAPAAYTPEAARDLTDPHVRAERAAEITRGGFDERQAAGQEYRERAAALQQSTESKRAEQEKRTEDVRADLEERRVAYKKLEEEGQPAMTTVEKVVMLGTLIAGLIDPSARKAAITSMQAQVKNRAQAFAETMARAERGIGLARGELADAQGDEDRIEATARLVEADYLRDLGQQMDQIAAQTENLQAREQMLYAGQDARDKADALERAAVKKGEDRLMERTLKAQRLALGQQQLEAGERKARAAARGPSAHARELKRLTLASKRVDLAAKVQKLHGAGAKKEALEMRDYGVRLPSGEYVLTSDKLEQRERFVQQLVGAENFVNAVDDIVRLRKEHGQEWSVFVKSKAGRQMAEKAVAAKLAAKKFYKLGAITEADAEIIDGLLGGDPTKFDSTIASLLSARDTVIDETNTETKYKVRKGVAWKPWKPVAPTKAKPSAIEFEARARASKTRGEEKDIIKGWSDTIKSGYGTGNKGYYADQYRTMDIVANDPSFPDHIRSAAKVEAKRVLPMAQRQAGEVPTGYETIFPTAKTDRKPTLKDQSQINRRELKAADTALSEAATGWLPTDESGLMPEYEALVDDINAGKAKPAAIRDYLTKAAQAGSADAAGALARHRAAVEKTSLSRPGK